MKILFDFLPIILFFATFKYAENHADWASAYASEHFGVLVSGGIVGAKEAPVLLATLVVIVATLAQVVILKLRRHKVSAMLWISLGLVAGLGGLTIWFHSETFIKWKPTVLYWIMGLALWAGPALFGKNLLRLVIGDQLKLPDRTWARLNLSWIVFFALMGLLNLWVAYSFSTSTWVSFKLFGGIGLTFAFTIAQAVYLSRHMPEHPAPAPDDTPAAGPRS